MRRFLSRLKSLRFTLIVIVGLCWLLPTTLLGGFMHTRLDRTLVRKTIDTLSAQTNRVGMLLDGQLGQLLNLSRTAIYDDEINQAHRAFVGGTLTETEYARTVRNYLDRRYGRETLLMSAFFADRCLPSTLISTSSSTREVAELADAVYPRMMEISNTLDTGCMFFDDGGQMYLVRNLLDAQLNVYGTLILRIDPKALRSTALEGVDDTMTSFAFTVGQMSSGDIIAAPEGLYDENGQFCYTIVYRHDDYVLTLQAQMDREKAFHENIEMDYILRLMLILLLPICMAILVFTQLVFNRPITILQDAAERIEGGDIGFVVPLDGESELGKLGRTFSKMSLQLKTLIDKSYKEEIALRDARIEAMQSRINPHFLGNALETINWQARMNDDEQVADMVQTLGVLLTASVARNERHLVPLHEELEIAQAYLYFIRQRYGERINTECIVDEEVSRDAMIPRLVTQVLLENAVEHGIAPAGGGHIRLTISRLEDKLHIDVCNNGVPLTEVQLSEIRKLLQEPKAKSGHIGITNVRQRLLLLFPDKADLTIGVDDSRETHAHIYLPYVLYDESEVEA